MTGTSAKLHIDVWSDIACPWCWVGKKRLEAALAKFAHRADVDVTWHSFELDPGAPRERVKETHAEMLSKKYGASLKDAQAMIDRMTQVGRGDGIDFQFDKARSGNTFDGHRLIHLAKAHGLQEKMNERLFRAYFSEGEWLGDHDVLTRLAVEVGLDENETRAALRGDAYAVDVREDESTARQIGVRGVPFFVLAERYAVSGAQPVEVLVRALETAYAELTPSVVEGAACGPDGAC